MVVAIDGSTLTGEGHSPVIIAIEGPSGTRKGLLS
jgi:hypothetical protein